MQGHFRPFLAEEDGKDFLLHIEWKNTFKKKRGLAGPGLLNLFSTGVHMEHRLDSTRDDYSLPYSVRPVV
jgi:hypothetical protein